MKVLQCPLLGVLGRFGNQIIEYLLCLAYASRNNAILETPPWIGEILFGVSHKRIGIKGTMIVPGDPQAEKNDIVAVPMFWEWPKELVSELNPFNGIRTILKWQPRFTMSRIPIKEAVAHVRGTDWKLNKNLPQLTETQILEAIQHVGFSRESCTIVSDEKTSMNDIYERELDHIYDFQLMIAAKHLFTYPSSTYSFCASLFSENLVYDIHSEYGKTVFVKRIVEIKSQIP